MPKITACEQEGSLKGGDGDSDIEICGKESVMTGAIWYKEVQKSGLKE